MMPFICSAFEGIAQGCLGLSWVDKPEPKPGEHGSRVETPKGYEGLLDLLIWLGF